MPSFNGFPIIPMPTAPAVKSLEFNATDVVGDSTSPFTGQQQIQDWQAAFLRATVTLPPMSAANAAQWIAFFMAVRGKANVFQLGDPTRVAPGGSGSGTPVVNGAGQSGFTLSTRGWTHGAANVLLPYDAMQIGYRLYWATSAVTADGSGDAIVNIWPNLREAPADGTSIVLNSTQGIWRMDGNDRRWRIDPGKAIPSMQFTIREAI